MGSYSSKSTPTESLTIPKVVIKHDISHVEGFWKTGHPNVKVTFYFPSSDNDNKFEAKVHREIVEKSPVLKSWMDVAESTENDELAFEADIHGCDGDDFEKFLIYLYTEELNPDELICIFDFALRFQVKLNKASFVEALTGDSAFQLLNEFKMTHPSQAGYRELILDKLKTRCGDMLKCEYFKKLKPETLIEVMKAISKNRKVENIVLWDALWEWGKEQCLRAGIACNTDTLMEVIPPNILTSKDAIELASYFIVKFQPSVFVKTADGMCHPFCITINEQVSVLTRKIADKLQVENPRVIFRGRILDEKKYLNEYGIQIGDTILLVHCFPQ